MGLSFSTLIMGSVCVMGQPLKNESNYRQDLNSQKYVLIPMTEYDEITTMGHENQQMKGKTYQQMMLPEIMKPLYPKQHVVLEVIESDNCEGYEAKSRSILVPHPSSNTKFLMCISKKMAVEMDCALGTRFDEHTMGCNRFVRDPLEFYPGYLRVPRIDELIDKTI
ncbi:hypothetical protein GJ496_005502 [Pomphorhynchus laevis]|nr:hypothetical protein GJ496_005502 [Pomphorhynchus laevis]